MSASPAPQSASRNAGNNGSVKSSVSSNDGPNIQVTSTNTPNIKRDPHPRLTPAITASAGVNIPLFLTKTFEMLSACDPDVACWTPAGDMFVVKNQNQLGKQYIPRYFDHSNFSSFARQLNFYGFRKISPRPVLSPTEEEMESANHISFYNSKFHRDHPEWLHEIKRSKASGGVKNCDANRSRETEEFCQKLNSISNHISDQTSQLQRHFDEKYDRMYHHLYTMSDEIRELRKLVTVLTSTPPAPVSMSGMNGAYVGSSSAPPPTYMGGHPPPRHYDNHPMSRVPYEQEYHHSDSRHFQGPPSDVPHHPRDNMTPRNSGHSQMRNDGHHYQGYPSNGGGPNDSMGNSNGGMMHRGSAPMDRYGEAPPPRAPTSGQPDDKIDAIQTLVGLGNNSGEKRKIDSMNMDGASVPI